MAHLGPGSPNLRVDGMIAAETFAKKVCAG